MGLLSTFYSFTLSKMENLQVRNLVSTRTGTPVANQLDVDSDYKDGMFTLHAFQSYKSLIATLNDETKTLTIYPYFDYSRTTNKYFLQWLKLYFGPCYAETIKNMAKKWNDFENNWITVVMDKIQP